MPAQQNHQGLDSAPYGAGLLQRWAAAQRRESLTRLIEAFRAPLLGKTRAVLRDTSVPLVTVTRGGRSCVGTVVVVGGTRYVMTVRHILAQYVDGYSLNGESQKGLPEAEGDVSFITLRGSEASSHMTAAALPIEFVKVERNDYVVATRAGDTRVSLTPHAQTRCLEDAMDWPHESRHHQIRHHSSGPCLGSGDSGSPYFYEREAAWALGGVYPTRSLDKVAVAPVGVDSGPGSDLASFLSNGAGYRPIRTNVAHDLRAAVGAIGSQRSALRRMPV